MSSVLGKRARTTEASADTSVSARVKRRAHISLVNDENLDPNDSHNGGTIRAHGSEGLGHSPSKPNIPASTRSREGSRRVALSPRKANGQHVGLQESPKSENIVQLPTPKTPRHRDALSKRVPITPRHKIGLLGKPLTPRTPRTPSTPSSALTVYHGARQLFTSGANPGPLVGREDERGMLQAFVQEGIASKAGRCLYVSGPPGTGKSALVGEVCRSVKRSEGVKTAHINCMSAKHSEDIYGKLVEELVDDDSQFADGMTHLRAIFMPKKKTSKLVYVVTLDEIDYLLTLDLEILYTLFEWSLHPSSHLIIIGIANALDLTDRFLPRLKARNLKLQLLPFLPYTAPQIASVITTKLKSVSSTDSTPQQDQVAFVHPTAIQLCSKKVAAQSGDLRKAFDIIRRTLDLIEMETKQKFENDFNDQQMPLTPSKTSVGNTFNSQSPVESPFARLTPSTAPRATVAHVSRVSAAILSNGTSQRLQTLNLQQQAVLCALISHQKKSRATTSLIFATPLKAGAAPPVRKVYETYCTLCRQENALHPLTSTEFVDVISGLGTLGLVGEENGGRGFGAMAGTPSRKGKGIVEERVLCFVDEDEVKACLKGVGRGLLMGLLSYDA